MNYRLTILILIGGFLGACSGGDSGGSDDKTGDPTATAASITSFTVNGTSDPLIPGSPEPINPGENNGQFTVSYSVDANGTVDIELSVTEAGQPPVTCGNEATEFYDRKCGQGKSCGLSGQLSCSFSSQNLISCDSGPATDLTEFLDQIPKEADMVLCVTRRNGGAASVERVEFQ